MVRYVAGLASIAIILAGAARAEEAPSSSMDAAMMRMHEQMSAAANGDPDHDFAAMMIPHHQGAIDMARAELKNGKDPELRRLARAIITAQEREIATMKRALARLKTNPIAPAPMAPHAMH